MKLIVSTKTREIKYVFPDEARVALKQDRIEAPGLVVLDLNAYNAELVEGVETIPDDYKGCKYLYENGEFTLNPDYTEPGNV